MFFPADRCEEKNTENHDENDTTDKFFTKCFLGYKLWKIFLLSS